MYNNSIRIVPLSLKLKCYFGGIAPQIGWLLILLGAGSLLLCMNFINLREFTANRSASADGIVTEVNQTNASEGGSGKGNRNPGRPIMEYHFKFNFGGKEYFGRSYSSLASLQPGAPVKIDLDPSAPQDALISGMRSSIFSHYAALIALTVPGTGFTLAFLGFIRGKKNIALLSEGMLTTGKLVEERLTNVRINNLPVIEYIFEFKTREGTMSRVSAKTHLREKLTGSETEQILFDPRDSKRALLLDTLPGRPQFGPMGDIVGSSGSPLAFLLPLLALSAYGYALSELIK